MPPKRMTANPLKPARYRPGKPTAASEASSSSEAEDDEGDDDAADDASSQQRQQQIPQRSAVPPPKATSFANVDLKARRQAAEQQDLQRKLEEARERERMEREAGFVTESSEEESGSEDEGSGSEDSNKITHRPKVVADTKKQLVKQESGSEDEDESGEEESSSSEEDRPVRLRPTFIRKDQRGSAAAAAVADPVAEAEAKAAAEEQRRQKETEELIRERIERDAAARAAGRKGWDDDEGDEDEIPDDTDGLDAELERTQWVARELGRLKRARAALEEREAEIAEVERRRGLSAAEREREDQEFLAEQAERKKERGKMAPLQKYHHRGAFFGDEARELGLLDRDIMGARFEDQVSGGGGTAGVPEYLRVRDATMIGRKGRTRYRDLKSEDTGRWGEGFDDGRRGDRRESGQGRPDYSDVKDERFRPDYGGDARGATGANASALGQKRAGHGESSERDGKRTRVD